MRKSTHDRPFICPILDGEPVSESPHRDGFESPVIHWTPSIAVSSLLFYNGELFPDWKQDLLVATLNHQQLILVEMAAGSPTTQTLLFEGLGRIRDLEQGLDGVIYLLLERSNHSSLVKLVPVSQ